MKKFLLFTTLTLALISCQDSKDNAGQKLPKHFDKCVGEQIPFDVALRWTKNFSRNIAAGRDLLSYSIAETLTSVLNASADRMSVLFHHATDAANDHHILLFTIQDDGALFESEVIDLTTGSLLSNTTARLWAANYSSAHATILWYHFFGNDIFSEIQSCFEHRRRPESEVWNAWV